MSGTDLEMQMHATSLDPLCFLCLVHCTSPFMLYWHCLALCQSDTTEKITRYDTTEIIMFYVYTLSSQVN